jgi:hypothetical protein
MIANRRAGPRAANVPNITRHAAIPIMLRQNNCVCISFCKGSSILQKGWKKTAAVSRNAATMRAPMSGQIPKAIDTDPRINHTPVATRRWTEPGTGPTSPSPPSSRSAGCVPHAARHRAEEDCEQGS